MATEQYICLVVPCGGSLYELDIPARDVMTHSSPAIGTTGRSEYIVLFFSRRSMIASRELSTIQEVVTTERCITGPG